MRNRTLWESEKRALGRRLRHLRVDVFKLNQEDMSELLGASTSMYQRWESGETEPGALWLQPLVRKHAVDAAWLFCGTLKVAEEK